MPYFATEYTIHFDDTMAYGSHHFLTAFKFQCASREAFLFGERIFDIPGVKEALDRVHLLTSDAYTRNLRPAKLGDRVAILLSLEEWGRVSARFCYRVLGQEGQAICAGFQNLICADANTQLPVPLPAALSQAMNAMREIAEPQAVETFRDRVLAGGNSLETLFGDIERQLARSYLSQRYPSPMVLAIEAAASPDEVESVVATPERITHSEDIEPSEVEAWIFAGQAAFDAALLSERVLSYMEIVPTAKQLFNKCAQLVVESIGGDAFALVSGCREQCHAAVQATPALSQIAIHLQNVLGAKLWQSRGHTPGILIGHSFGEIAALGIGGCFDLLTGVHIVCLRIQAITEHAPTNGGLLVVACDRGRALIEANLLGLLQVVVAGRNHDAQTVMSGPVVQLNELKLRLQELSIASTLIPSPTSFHHPQLRTAASNWLKQLRTLELQPPTSAIYSSIGRRFIDSSEDIAALLAGQLVRPFDLQGAIANALQVGVTSFVDCGSTGSMAHLLVKAGVNESQVCQVKAENFIDKSTFTAINPQQSIDLETVDADRPHEQFSHSTNDDGIPRVAITAQGCILPGGVRTPESLYSAIIEQRMGIVDQSEFDPDWLEDFYSKQLTPDRSNSRLTGRVEDSDITVPDGVSPQVFKQFTRAQKLLCIALKPCVAALEGAKRILCLVGATADGFEDQDEVSSLRFAGIDPREVVDQLRLHDKLASPQTPHEAVQEVFDRIIRPGLKVTLVDAACASSLYTVALGMQALETDKADAVIAGGFFCPGPGNSCLFSQFRGTTSSGCRPFDAGADGVVFSEGAALVTLRRLEDAQQFRLNIQATVLGAGLSSDGKSSSANVPQSRGQLLSLQRCYKNYDIDPRSIVAIEGHGTSTPVGDSTEIETLRQFFSGHTEQPISLHSLKGLLGHAGWAAGTASVIAVCQYMKNGVFPPQAEHRQPSAALKKAEGTLAVAAQPVALPETCPRIAIDGFGFGGANAHLVLEGYSKEHSVVSGTVRHSQPTPHADQQLVIVAFHQEHAATSNTEFRHFDREAIRLPQQYVVLPELAEDMDISQILAVILTERILKQLPELDVEVRQETSLVMALSGKTERGMEATMRILTPRIRRRLEGDKHSLALLNRAYQNARPSGTYTLQCMMPNVAAGRAALLTNINGPNFVVDAGAKSVEAAFENAALLLHSGQEGGTKLALVSAIHVNTHKNSPLNVACETSEYAASFALTTRQFAREKGLRIISSMDAMLKSIHSPLESMADGLKPNEKIDQMALALARACRTDADELEFSTSNPENSEYQDSFATTPSRCESSVKSPSENRPENSVCQIHSPIWVEKALPPNSELTSASIHQSLLVIVPVGFEPFDELMSELSIHSQRFRIVVLGNAADGGEPFQGRRNTLYVNLSNEKEVAVSLARIEDFRADFIVALDRVKSWSRHAILTSLATDNSLCEFLFQVGQRHTARLEDANVELWGLLLDGWNGNVHPASGPIAGLLKSIHREFPRSRTGTICTQNLGLAEAFGCWRAERHDSNCEQEIVYAGRLRLVVRLRPVSSAGVASTQLPINSDSVVVASGGAKGVTAVMLEALLRDYGCTVIAIGRSQLEAGPPGFDTPEFEQQFYERMLRENPRATAREMKNCFQRARGGWEAQKTIDELAAAGGHVEYAVADITDQKKLEEVFADIVSRYGKIDLLLHGAGIQISKRLCDRSLAEFRETFSIKVGGLHSLAECCIKVLGHTTNMHILTSAYSFFGNDGQHDYGAANQALDRLCSVQDQDINGQWSSIAWLAWEGIGMTRGSEYAALAKKRRLSGVDRELGQLLFRQVLSGKTNATINIPMSAAEHCQYSVRTIPAATANSFERTIEVDVKLSNIECLPFHKIRNTPTLPGAWILDLLVKAGVQLASPDDRLKNLNVENMSFSRFVRFANEQEPNVRVIAQQVGRAIDVWLVADVLHPTGVVLSRDVLCASARIRFDNGTSISSILGKFSEDAIRPRKFVKDPYCFNEREVSLSGPFDCLREIEINEASRRAKFTSDRPRNLFNHVPALLLDAAWRVGAMYAVSEEESVFVPVKIGRMSFPQNAQTSSLDSSSWEILSTTPCTDQRDVRWDRTEVIDEFGQIKLVVEDAFATRLL